MARSKKKSNILTHFIAYCMIMGLISTFRILPWKFAHAIAWGGALLFFHAVPRRREITLKNLKRAFGGEKTDQELESLAKESYRSLARSAVEFVKFGQMKGEELLKHVKLEGEENFNAAAAKGRGVIAFGLHLGNWELPNTVHALRWEPPTIVGRALDNPFLDRWVNQVRERFGTRVINSRKRGAVVEILQALRKGGSVGFVMDQNVVGDRGIFVDFFRELAYTHKVVALVAQKTGAPLVPVYGFREKDGTHRIIYGKPIDPISTDDRSRDLLINTQRLSRVLETCVRDHPDQWFWMHNRWKKKPKPGALPLNERAVFLDRDGTISEEIGYIRDLTKLSLIKNSAEAIRLFNQEGLKTLVVTNQSGVARGYYSEEYVKRTNQKLEKLLREEGANLEGIYYCPHHPTEGVGAYTVSCDCRKPGPGMFLKAELEHGVRLSQSFVVGDKLTDMEAAGRMGARAILVRSGYGQEELRRAQKSGDPHLDFVADDLLLAAQWIIQQVQTG